jgi:hypothetical protein
VALIDTEKYGTVSCNARTIRFQGGNLARRGEPVERGYPEARVAAVGACGENHSLAIGKNIISR